MQVGDLVELSSSGREERQNRCVYGLWGIIMENKLTWEHPYRIDWYSPDGTVERVPMSRHEIIKLEVINE